MKKTLLFIPVFLAVFLLFILPFDQEVYLKPISAKDSDGKLSEDILSSQDELNYFIILKTYPFGYMQIDGWKNSEVKDPKLKVEWKTNEFGAGNIYLGYSLGNDWIEAGPFNESNEFTTTIIDLPEMPDYSELSFRFRGEDLDFGVDAIAWVKTELVAKKQVYGIISMVI